MLIPFKLYRDETHVYFNNPDGTTTKIKISDFLNAFKPELPAVEEGDEGGVLTVTESGIAWVVPEDGGE